MGKLLGFSEVKYVWINRQDSTTHKSPSCLIIGSSKASSVPSRANPIQYQSSIDLIVDERMLGGYPIRQYRIENKANLKLI